MKNAILYALVVISVILIMESCKIDLTPLSYTFLLISNIVLLYKSKDNLPLLFLTGVILYCNYSIVFVNYLTLIDLKYTEPLSANSRIVSLNILCLYNFLIFILIGKIRKIPQKDLSFFIDKKNKNPIICILLYIILTYIFIVGASGPSYSGGRGAVSPIYEYSIVFFILLFYYSGRNRIYVNVGLFYIIIYSLQMILFGNRIVALQNILVAYIMIFAYKVNLQKTITLGAMFFILFSVIGVVRGSLLYSNINILDIITDITGTGFALDTAYSAYYTSNSFVYLVDEFPDVLRLRYFADFIISIFMGESYNPSSSLPTLTHTIINHDYGGIMPHYLFFYVGIWGVILAVLITFPYILITKKINAGSSGIMKCLTVFVVSTTFRWYLYSPLLLLRGVLLFILIYYLFYIINKFVSVKCQKI